jgi:hypothetical protein
MVKFQTRLRTLLRQGYGGQGNIHMLKWQIARPIIWSAAMVYLFLGISVFTQAQKAIGAKSGVVQYSSGEVFLDGTPLKLARDGHVQVENGQVLSTKKGYVELVLAPAAYLWLGENASLRMRQNKLNDIQLQIDQGSALAYVLETIKKFPINVHVSKRVIEIRKAGLYRIDAVPGRLRVYSGDALVKDGNKQTRIKKGRMVPLDVQSAPAKFDAKLEDALHRLAIQRSSEIAVWMRHSQIEEEMRNTMRGLTKDTFQSEMQSQADQVIRAMREAERRAETERAQQEMQMQKNLEHAQQEGAP